MATKKIVKKGLAAVFEDAAQRLEETETRTNMAELPTKAIIGRQKGDVRSPLLKRDPETMTTSPRSSGKNKGDKVRKSVKKKPGSAPDGKVKATYYVDEILVARMKHIAVDFGKSYSDLIEEGLQVIITKYQRKQRPLDIHR